LYGDSSIPPCRFPERDLHGLPEPGLFPLDQGRENPDHEVGAAEEVDEGRTGPHRRAVGEAGRRHHSRARLDGEIHSAQGCVRAVGGIGLERRVDQPGVDRLKVVEVDPEP
jgi:hypothetical protein